MPNVGDKVTFRDSGMWYEGELLAGAKNDKGESIYQVKPISGGFSVPFLWIPSADVFHIQK
jgi:hypothetical protein